MISYQLVINKRENTKIWVNDNMKYKFWVYDNMKYNISVDLNPS